MPEHTCVCVYASEWGSTEAIAKKLFPTDSPECQDCNCGSENSRRLLKTVAFTDTSSWLDPILESSSKAPVAALFLIGTAADGEPPEGCKGAIAYLSDLANDHREERDKLSHVSFACVAFGDSSFGGDTFCLPGREVDRALRSLGARRCFRLLTVDSSRKHALLERFLEERKDWLVCCAQDLRDKFAVDTDDESSDRSFETDDEENEFAIEDLGSATKTEMLSALQAKTLRRQGYKLIGGHSAVKLCRWAKNYLRGRGGCYKWGFYGIQSHRCMETTSSLACASRCRFCWRAQTNPVSRDWHWEVDEPKFIVEGGLDAQARMIKELRGMPGALESGRLEEAMEVRHCALSLVGEPIMYPRISELLGELHERRISTFLVTNAQFPEQMRDLAPCTQLYVSIDASNKEDLRKIDRPLFKDFWERFEACLCALRHRQERTVYRLTLVKDYNVDDVSGYADLVCLGHPDLIELKGVTFAGDNGPQGIRMTNVPTHEEVTEFAMKFCDKLQALRQIRPDLPSYEIALEHEHSCSILLARSEFKSSNGGWKLWIDFDRFFSWALEVQAGNKELTGVDYSMDAPEWALFGSETKGFDPNHTRKYSKNRLKAMMQQSQTHTNTQSN